MKKLLALTLALTFVFSLAACGKKETKKAVLHESIPAVTDEAVSNETVEQPENDTEEIIETTTPEISLEDVKDFNDFADRLDKSQYKPTLKENNDGSVTVNLDTQINDEETTKPAIPTIDKIPEPKPTPTPKPAPTPEIEKEEDKNSDEQDTKDEPAEEITPEPEIIPEPEITPTPEPEPTPAIPEKEEEKKPTYTYTSNQKHTKVPVTERYLYSVLDEEKKGWYRAIDKAVNNLEEEAVFNVSMSENRNYYIYYLYMFDNPEHFYLGNTVTIYNYGGGKTALVFCYSDGKLTCRYGSSLARINDELRAGIRAKKAVFDAEVERIISTIPNDAPAVVKEKLIYDRILIDSHYNLSAKWDGIAEDNWTAYGILVNKYGVCESYSEAFQTLCLAVGINCTGVVGTAGGGHKWNCVQLDGEWYMCDITFDDPIGGDPDDAYHFYFNLTSAKMKELSHDWSDSNWPVPECTGTKYSYSYFN